MPGRKCAQKRRYDTFQAAKFFGDVMQQRVYRCPFCQGWHLTTQPKRTRQLDRRPVE